MLFQGILFGISLSFLIGPLLFAVVEAGIAQGFRAGIAVATGIWFGDILFVGSVLWGIETLTEITAWEGLRDWVGLMGGLLLLAFGAGSFWSKVPNHALENAGLKQRSYLAWWLRGFLLNIINPGTIFFWLGLVSAVVIPNNWSTNESLVFFGGMLGTLVITDTLKAWAAKRIGRFLSPKHMRQVQKAIGLLLMIFGIVLIFRVILTVF